MLEDGDLLQIDGINGSGKSTLLQLCVGLIRATTGTIFWNAENIIDCRYQFQSNISYIGHADGIKADLTVQENITLMHSLSGSPAAVDYPSILKLIGVAGTEKVFVKRLSAGQRRRIGLARLFMTPAKLWLLDEPFNTLDKYGKTIIEQLIVQHCATGGMVIFAAHQLLEMADYTLQHIHLGHH